VGRSCSKQKLWLPWICREKAMFLRLVVLGSLAVCGLSSTCPSQTTESATKSATQPVVVLDTAGFWRMHQALKAPVAQVDGRLKRIPSYESNTRLAWQEGQLNFWRATAIGLVAAVHSRSVSGCRYYRAVG